MTVADQVAHSISIVYRDGGDPAAVPAPKTISRLAADAADIGYAYITVKDTNGLAMAGEEVELKFSNDYENVQGLADVTDGGSTAWPTDFGEYLTYTATTGSGDYQGMVVIEFLAARAGTTSITATYSEVGTPLSTSRSLRTVKGTQVVNVKMFLKDGVTLAENVAYDANEVIELRLSPVDNGDNVITHGLDIVDIEVLAKQETGVPAVVTDVYRGTSTGTAETLFTIEAGRMYETIFHVDSEGRSDIDLDDDIVRRVTIP